MPQQVQFSHYSRKLSQFGKRNMPLKLSLLLVMGHLVIQMHFGLTHDDELSADTNVVYRTVIVLVKISVLSTSFLIHHIYLKLHLIVWIILSLERVLVVCGMVVFYLTPYSVINVRLAVLSTTASKVCLVMDQQMQLEESEFCLMLINFSISWMLAAQQYWNRSTHHFRQLMILSFQC